MTRTTTTEGFTPNHITVTEAENRLGGIRQLASEGQFELAQAERARLYLETLYSIANAPGIADKGEMRKLARIALEAMSVPITPRQT